MLGRSQFMRSSDGLAKMASSYMGEPTKTYNLFYRTYRDAVQEQDPQKRVQARKRMGRTAGALVFSMFLNAIAQSLWDAVRDDDDRDEKYWERVLGHIGPNFAQNVNPLGMVPYLRDILSILQGYDVERMDLSAVASFFSAVQNMGKAINGEGRYTVLGAGANLLAELAGSPACPWRRSSGTRWRWPHHRRGDGGLALPVSAGAGPQQRGLLRQPQGVLRYCLRRAQGRRHRAIP